MANFEVIYVGELRCNAKHIDSGIEILTDAPKDNHGKGESFSPTDLLATSLGTCMITVMGIEARSLKIDISGTILSISKTMGTLPRRVVEVGIELKIPDRNFTEQEKNKLIDTGLNCPVAKSLHPNLKQNIQFQFIKM
jgi:putative redox protein